MPRQPGNVPISKWWISSIRKEITLPFSFAPLKMRMPGISCRCVVAYVVSRARRSQSAPCRWRKRNPMFGWARWYWYNRMLLLWTWKETRWVRIMFSFQKGDLSPACFWGIFYKSVKPEGVCIQMSFFSVLLLEFPVWALIPFRSSVHFLPASSRSTFSSFHPWNSN